MNNFQSVNSLEQQEYESLCDILCSQSVNAVIF